MTVKRRRELAVAAALFAIGLTAWMMFEGRTGARDVRRSAASPEKTDRPSAPGIDAVNDSPPSTTVPLKPAGKILRWSDVPLRAALIPSGIAAADGLTIASDHSRLFSWIATQEIDFGVEAGRFDALREGLGMVATIDALLFIHGGQRVHGHPFWTGGAEIAKWFPLGLAGRSLTPEDPEGLRTKLIEVLSGNCGEVIRRMPAQFQVPDLEAGVRTRALMLLSSLAKPADEAILRSAVEPDQPATLRAAALVGLEKLGHSGETAELIRRWYASESGMRPALLTALAGEDFVPTMIAPDSRVGGRPLSSFGASHDDFVAEAFALATEPTERSMAVRSMMGRAGHPGIREHLLQVLESSDDVGLIREVLNPGAVELLRDPRYYEALKKHARSEDLPTRLMAGVMMSHYPVQETLDLALQWTRDVNERVVRQGITMLTTAGRIDPAAALQRIEELQEKYAQTRTALYLSWARNELKSFSQDRQKYLDRYAGYFEKLQVPSTPK